MLEIKGYPLTTAIFQDLISKMISLIFHQLRLAFLKHERQWWNRHSRKRSCVKSQKESLQQLKKKSGKSKRRLKLKTEGKFKSMFNQQELLPETSQTLSIKIILEEQLYNPTVEATQMSLLEASFMAIIRKHLTWTHIVILTSLSTTNRTQRPWISEKERSWMNRNDGHCFKSSLLRSWVWKKKTNISRKAKKLFM